MVFVCQGGGKNLRAIGSCYGERVNCRAKFRDRNYSKKLYIFHSSPCACSSLCLRGSPLCTHTSNVFPFLLTLQALSTFKAQTVILLPLFQRYQYFLPCETSYKVKRIIIRQHICSPLVLCALISSPQLGFQVV